MDEAEERAEAETAAWQREGALQAALEAVQARAAAAEERAANAELVERERKAQLQELKEKLEFLQVYAAWYMHGTCMVYAWYMHACAARAGESATIWYCTNWCS